MHQQQGSLRSKFSGAENTYYWRPKADGRKAFLQENAKGSTAHAVASRVVPRRMPTVVHSKEGGHNYTEGSPLYDKQEGMEIAAGNGTEMKHPLDSNMGGGSSAEATGVGGETGRAVVYGMGATIVLLSLTFAMANSSRRLVSNFTWLTLDNVICIFLAVLVFQAIDEVVYDAELIPQSHFVLGSFVYAICLLLIAVGLSYLLKGTPSNLAIFVASSAHFVAFGFMHAATLGFEHHTNSVWNAILVFVVVLAIIAGVYTMGYHLRKVTGLSTDTELVERIEDLENDAGAMAASMSWTILMCYFLTRKFQDVIETEAVTRTERQYMLIYAFAISILGGAVIFYTSGREPQEPDTPTSNKDPFETHRPTGILGSYVRKRLGMFCSAALAMCAAWSWLLWGKWQFHESDALEHTPMFNRIAFATYASLAAMVLILILAYLPSESSNFKKDKALAILTVSLVVGWAWEETFDAGIEILAEGQQHQARCKIIAAACLIAIVLPVHVIYFKPILANLPREEFKYVDAKSTEEEIKPIKIVE